MMTTLIAPLLCLLAAGPTLKGEATFRPGPEESRVPERFRLEEATFPYEMEELRDEAHGRVWALRFPSPIVTPDEENNTVHAEYFPARDRQGGERAPGVVVLHILGGDFALSRYVAERLAERGVAALFVKLPYYGERRPEDKKFLSDDIERTIRAVRQGVCDVRRASAWLAGRPEIDPNRLGVTGISLGGIVSALAVAADPEIQSGCLFLAGGDLTTILWEMPEAEPFRERWIASGRDREDFRRLVEPLDPLTYADRLRGKRVLMLNGNVDEVVPPRCTRALWNAAGRPPIHWFDCGHYSAVGYLLPGVRQAADFFAEESAEARHSRNGTRLTP